MGYTIPSLVFCSETPQLEVVRRMLFGRSSCALSDCERGYIPPADDLKKIREAALETAQSGLLVCESRNLTLEALVGMARKVHQENPIGFIAIEDIHKIQPSAHGMNAKAALAEAVSGLKGLARELNVPILTTAHLRKSSWNRRAGLEDLRHASVLAYDADLIAILQPMLRENGFDLVVCSVVKNPNGRHSEFDLYHDSRLIRLSEKPVPNEEECEKRREWN